MTKPQLGAGVSDEVSCSTLTRTGTQAFLRPHDLCTGIKKSSAGSLERRRTAFSYTLKSF